MIFQKSITLPGFRKGFHLITPHIIDQLPSLPCSGIMHVFIHHTSAGLIISENADPSVAQDLNISFDKIAPENDPDHHHTMEGPDDMPAHIKNALVGSSISIPISSHRLNVGTWQGIFLCEFRNRAMQRKITITVYGE